MMQQPYRPKKQSSIHSDLANFPHPTTSRGASPGASDLGKDEHKEVGCSRQYVLVTARLTAVLFLAQANRCRSKSRCHAEILHDPAGSTDRFLGCSVAGGEAPASRRRSRSQFRWWQPPLAPSAEMAPSEILLILLERGSNRAGWSSSNASPISLRRLPKHASSSRTWSSTASRSACPRSNCW